MITTITKRILWNVCILLYKMEEETNATDVDRFFIGSGFTLVFVISRQLPKFILRVTEKDWNPGAVSLLLEFGLMSLITAFDQKLWCVQNDTEVDSNTIFYEHIATTVLPIFLTIYGLNQIAFYKELKNESIASDFFEGTLAWGIYELMLIVKEKTFGRRCVSGKFVSEGPVVVKGSYWISPGKKYMRDSTFLTNEDRKYIDELEKEEDEEENGDADGGGGGDSGDSEEEKKKKKDKDDEDKPEGRHVPVGVLVILIILVLVFLFVPVILGAWKPEAFLDKESSQAWDIARAQRKAMRFGVMGGYGGGNQNVGQQVEKALESERQKKEIKELKDQLKAQQVAQEEEKKEDADAPRETGGGTRRGGHTLA